jgi:hypothetical protein
MGRDDHIFGRGTEDKFWDVRAYNHALSDEQMLALADKTDVTELIKGVEEEREQLIGPPAIGPPAFTFDKYESHISKPVNLGQAYDLPGGAFSMAAWVQVALPGQLENQAPGRIFSKRSDGVVGWEFVAPRINGKISFLGNQRHLDIGTTRLDDGVAHHVAVVYDGFSIIRAFLDGKLDGQQAIGPLHPVPEVDLWAGTYMGRDDHIFGRGTEDKFWDVRAYNHALSDEQMLALGAPRRPAKSAGKK